VQAKTNLFISVPLCRQIIAFTNLPNRRTVGYMTLPIRENDGLKRLKMIEQNLHQMQNTSLPIFLAILAVVCGSIPTPVLRMVQSLVGKGSQQWAFLSSFPGPIQELKFHQSTLKDIKWDVCFDPGQKSELLITYYIHYKYVIGFAVLKYPILSY
jgi:hypothetical protein